MGFELELENVVFVYAIGLLGDAYAVAQQREAGQWVVILEDSTGTQGFQGLGCSREHPFLCCLHNGGTYKCSRAKGAQGVWAKHGRAEPKHKRDTGGEGECLPASLASGSSETPVPDEFCRRTNRNW